MEEIYEGLTTNELIEVIHTQPKEAKTVFFFGHNPDFHYFAQNLLTKYTDEMPTCAAVVIDFDVDKWEKVVSRTGILAHRIVPKDLR
jgi:phosphohistidine phosphatase